MTTFINPLKQFSHGAFDANYSKMLYFMRLKDVLKDSNKLYSLGLYAIMLFNDGEGDIYVDTKQYSVNGNCLLLLNPSSILSCDSTGRALDGYCILLSPSLLNGFYRQFYNEEIEKKHIEAAEPACCLLSASAKANIDALFSMVQTYTSNHGGYLYDYGFSLSVTSLIFIFARNEGEWVGGKTTNLSKNANLELFIRFRKCVELNYRTEHNVAWYAKELSTSEYLLNQCVMMCEQKKALDFIMDRVVEEAQRLIVHSSLMIKEIAFKLGFKDDSYFIRYFKRRVGMSPLKYKKYMASISH